MVAMSEGGISVTSHSRLLIPKPRECRMVCVNKILGNAFNDDARESDIYPSPNPQPLVTSH